MIDYAAILTRTYTGALWTLNGDDYDGLTWLDESIKPTKTELDELWPSVQTEIEAEQIAQQSARDAAIAHAKSLGFTDEMIAVMYPGLTV